MYASMPRTDLAIGIYVIGYLLFFVGILVRTGYGATVIIAPGDTIECSGFASTPLPVAISSIAAFCAGNARCSELYGQDLGLNITLFDHLFQITNEIPAPVTLESPLLRTLCNRTVEQVNAKLWPSELKGAMLDSTIVCGLNDRPLFDISTGDTFCMSFPGREMRDPHEINGVVLTLMMLLVVSVVVGVGTGVWDTALRQIEMSNKAKAQRRR